MTNLEFYAYVKAQSKTEQDEMKRAACKDLYQYLFECGFAKAGVSRYINEMISQATQRSQPELASVYAWLRDVFAGNQLTADMEEANALPWQGPSN